MKKGYFVSIIILLLGIFFLFLFSVGEGHSGEIRTYFGYVKDNYGSPEDGPYMFTIEDDGTGNLIVKVTSFDEETGDPIYITGTGQRSGNNIVFTLPIIICADTGSDEEGTAVFSGTIDSKGNIAGNFVNTLPERDICKKNKSNVYKGTFRAEDVTNTAPVNIAGTYKFYVRPDSYPKKMGPYQVSIFQNGTNLYIEANTPEGKLSGEGTIYGKYVVLSIPVIVCEDTCLPDGTCPEPEDAIFIGRFNSEKNTIEGYYGDGVPAGDYCHYPGKDKYITPATGLWQAVRVGGGASQYTLKVTKSGSGSGVINVSGCDFQWTGKTGTCKAPAGTEITLTASPDANSVFVGWSGGGCSGTGTCTITLNANTNVKATFNKNQLYTLKVTKAGDGEGEVEVSGCVLEWNGKIGQCTAPAGTQITLTASADEDSLFAGWGGVSCGNSEKCTVTLKTSNTNVEVTFKKAYVFSISKIGEGEVEVKGCDFKWKDEDRHYGSCKVLPGTKITLTANPNANSVFERWEGIEECTTNKSCTITVNENKEGGAFFGPKM